MKHLNVFIPTLMAVLVCVSANPLPSLLSESSSVPLNATQLPVGDLQNSTSYEMIQTFSLENGPPLKYLPPRCALSTCALINLGSSLQSGDETAGASTKDSQGFGRK